MGLLVRSVQGYDVLLHHRYLTAYPYQSPVHRVWAEARDSTSCGITRSGADPIDRHLYYEAIHGQENERRQHLHCSGQLHQRHPTTLLLQYLWSTSKSIPRLPLIPLANAY